MYVQSMASTICVKSKLTEVSVYTRNVNAPAVNAIINTVTTNFKINLTISILN